MGMFENLNKSFESPFSASKLFAESEFINLSQLSDILATDEAVFTIRDFWINPKSKFGEHPVIGVEVPVTDKDTMLYNVSLPSHMTETVKGIINDSNCVQAVNGGHCGARVRQYHSKTYNKDCYSIEFVDI